MTDDSKVVASKANQKQMQEDEEINSQLFGGSEDIFEDSNIFQIEGNRNNGKFTQQPEEIQQGWTEKNIEDEFKLEDENITEESKKEFNTDEFTSEKEFMPEYEEKIEDEFKLEEDRNNEKLKIKNEKLEEEFKLNDEDQDEHEENVQETPGLDTKNVGLLDEEEDENKAQDKDDIEIQRDSDSNPVLKEKFYELYNFVSDIYQFSDLKEEEGFQLIGADNDKLNIIYKIFLDKNENSILISKIQTDKETDDQDQNDLNFLFEEENETLSVILNDVLIFDEAEEEDAKKQMQIVDKINKFIFLVGEYHKKLEEEINDKRAEEEERRKLHDIFRNF